MKGDHGKLHMPGYIDLMHISTWNDVGLGRMDEEITNAFIPLVQREAPRGDPQWSNHIWKRRRRILRGFAKRQLLGWRAEHQRNTATIVDEYDEVWGRGFERYQMQPRVRHKPWIWRSRRYWANSIAATRFRQAILTRIVERVRPKTVLEVGCGNGINLILLACRFPDIQFIGLELTSAGHKVAVEFQATNDALPESLQAFAPLPLADPTGFRRIRFIQGSAAELPLADGSVDLTMTVLALEQMERIRHQALSEIARVTAGHAFLLEPFRELNKFGWFYFNRIKRDYFAGRVRELPEFGLEPEFVVADYPQEAFLRTCAVLSRKSSANDQSSLNGWNLRS
jgi:SAM-dependent methyltransferase